MSVPKELVGAWRRSGILVDGNRVVDYSDVIWLQTPEVFADIRLPIDPNLVPQPGVAVPDFFYDSFAFAGTTDWETPTITWNHALDSNPDSGADSNRIEWARGVALEHGVAPSGDVDVPFTEEWLRMTDDDVTWSAVLESDFARVEVGNWAIEVRDERKSGGKFQAERFEAIRGDWKSIGTVQL